MPRRPGRPSSAAAGRVKRARNAAEDSSVAAQRQRRERAIGDGQTAIDITLDVLASLWLQDARRGVDPDQRRGISPAAHAAGWRLAKLRHRSLGMATLAPPGFYAVMVSQGLPAGRELPTPEEIERQDAAAGRAFAQYTEALRSLSITERHAVLDCCVQMVMPSHWRSAATTYSLQVALEKIAVLWKIHR